MVNMISLLQMTMETLPLPAIGNLREYLSCLKNAHNIYNSHIIFR